MSYGMHMDVSARQRAEQIVQHERARAQMAIEAIGVGIWERNAAGEVIHWNEAMYRLRGLSPDDPRTPEAITAATLHVEDQARFEALLRRLPQADTPVRDEFRVSLPDGSWRWLASEGRALRDAGGGLVGMAGVNFDVTERRHAELLRLETQRLEQAGRERAAFLARVSHDLRTPMNAVLGFTQLMQDDPQDAPSPTQQARLAHIGRAAQAMMVLIDDLLQITHGSTAPVSAARSAALDVLCIEDNPVNLQLVRELLALRPAVRLRTAESGMEGIATAVAGPPQLVLLDLHLPDLSGMEVMQRLRGIAAMEGCHIVALSADAMPESIRTALEAGFDDYWTKPIQFDHFLAGIDHLAAVHAAAVGPAALKAPGAP
jgi:PAS domain S-box-containing protein